MLVLSVLLCGSLLGLGQARVHSKMEDLSVVYVPIPDTVYVNNDTIAIEDQFGLYHYPPDAYATFIGLDDIALFSSAVSLTEDMIAVGSNGYNIFEGIVHIYDHQTECHWTLQQYIHSPLGDNAGFGNAVALERQRVVIGSNAWNYYTGKAFIYSLTQGVYWKLEAQLDSPLGYSQGFGYDVSLSGNTALVSTGVNNLYVYENQQYGWTLTADLQPPLPGIKFGHSAKISGDYIVAGAEAYMNSTGRVYIYYREPATNTWVLNTTLGSITGQNSYFGHSVDIYNDTIVVGAKGFQILQFKAQGHQTRNNTGWAYVYHRNPENGSWVLFQSITSPIGQNSFFGASVAVHKDSIIVGADGYPNGEITGAAFTYRLSADTLQYEMELALPSVAGVNGHFGWASDIVDSYSAVGAYGYDDLRGGMFLACRAGIPTSAPTSQPTGQPTSAPSHFGAAINSRDDGIVINKTKWPWGIVVAILIGVCLMATIIGLIIYCCCWFCCLPVALADKKKKKKKKKKEEEADSTYTVHGPGGLIDEDGTVYGPEFRTTGGSSIVSETVDSSESEEWEEETTTVVKKVKGGKKGGKKSAADGKFKVYGYTGPVEGAHGDDAERSAREKEKNGGVSSSSSSGAAVAVASVREDSDVVAAFKLSRQTDSRQFTKPKQSAEMAEIAQRAEEVVGIYEAPPTNDSFFDNAGLSEDPYDYGHPHQQHQQHQQQRLNFPVFNTQSTTTTQTSISNHVAVSSSMFVSPSHTSSDASIRSDGSNSSVKDAKARLNAYKAKLHSDTSSANTGGQTFHSHKERMEAEERQREEENARLRAHMEQTRLMAEAQEAAKAAEVSRAAEVESYRSQIEQARKVALEKEAAAKKANLSLMKAKAEEDAKQKLAQFKAQRDAEAAQRAQADMDARAAADAAQAAAEQQRAARQAEEAAAAAASAAAAVQAAVAEDEAQRAADKQRLKDEARIRAEEKAKARFLNFKAQAQSGAAPAGKPADDEAAREAVLAAKAKLDAINALLREKPAEEVAAPEVVVNNTTVVNQSSSETVTTNTVHTHTTNVYQSSSNVALEYSEGEDMV